MGGGGRGEGVGGGGGTEQAVLTRNNKGKGNAR